MRIVPFLFLCLIYVFTITSLLAKNYTVTGNSPYKITALMNIYAGDTIFLDPSRKFEICLDHLNGEAGKPIVVTNKNGLFTIIKGTVNIRISHSHHLKITGTGDPNYEYGIKLLNSVVMALSIEQFSDNIEIDHVEITGSGFSGITAKTDNYRDVALNNEERNFIMENIHLHHNKIHHLKEGEGFYIGHNSWPKDQDRDQHNISGIDIHDNYLEYIPREGIQVGACPDGKARIHHNTLKYFGTIYIDSASTKAQPDPFQNNGIQLGQGFSGDCYNNWIEIGTGKAMQLVGVHGCNVYNNVIIKPDSWAFYVGNGKKVIKEHAPINIIYNTIINPGQEAIKFDPQKDSVIGNFYNNLIFHAKAIKDPSGKSGIFTKDVDLKAYNLLENDAAKIKFANPTQNNFTLSKGSVAIQKAYDTSKPPVFFLPEFDYNYKAENTANKLKKRYDIGAFEFTVK